MSRAKGRLAAALVGLLSGCVTVVETPCAKELVGEGGSEGIETVEVINSGWFLFDGIPIATGDPEGGCKWFSDTLNAQTSMDVLGKYIRAHEATKIGVITSHETNEGVLIFLLNRHTFRTSATLLRTVAE